MKSGRGGLAPTPANMAKDLVGEAEGLATDRALRTVGGIGESHRSAMCDGRLFRIALIYEGMVANHVAQWGAAPVQTP